MTLRRMHLYHCQHSELALSRISRTLSLPTMISLGLSLLPFPLVLVPFPSTSNIVGTMRFSDSLCFFAILLSACPATSASPGPADPSDPSEPPESAALAPAGAGRYLGCATDPVERGLGRGLIQAAANSSTSMTLVRCRAFCDSKGFYFSGAEYGAECYCEGYQARILL